MNTQAKARSKNQQSNEVSPNVVWFEIPADDIERARTFYSKLFGWKVDKFPGPTTKPYWLIDTGADDASRNGGMMERQFPNHTITNYVAVPSVETAAAKVEKLGGEICMGKTAVPQMGYFVVCKDTENNQFALWEPDEGAK
jgi:uncharacterized protein